MSTSTVSATPASATPVTVVKTATLSNGAIAVTLRPNGDTAHDSSHTLYITAGTTPAEIQAWVAARKADTAAQYDAMQNAQTLLGSIT